MWKFVPLIFRLLILDEIDALESRKQTILYSIFEWPAITGSKLVLIGVANALDLTDRMLPRLQANVKLQPTLMNFAPYSKHQILDIISHKLKKVIVRFTMKCHTLLNHITKHPLVGGLLLIASGNLQLGNSMTNYIIKLSWVSRHENESNKFQVNLHTNNQLFFAQCYLYTSAFYSKNLTTALIQQ